MHQLVIIVAKYFIVLSALVTLAVWLKLERRLKVRFVIVAAVSAILAVVIAKIGSHLYYDPRPFVSGHFTPYFYHASDNGFPSDHSLLAATLAFVSWRYNRKLGYAAIAIGVLIGGARVIAGVHHVIDVVGSFAIAAIAVSLTIYVESRLHQPASKATHHASEVDD